MIAFRSDLQFLHSALNGKYPIPLPTNHDQFLRYVHAKTALEAGFAAAKAVNGPQQNTEHNWRDALLLALHENHEILNQHPDIPQGAASDLRHEWRFRGESIQKKDIEAIIKNCMTLIKDGISNRSHYIPSHISPTGELTPAGQTLMERKTMAASTFEETLQANPNWCATLQEDLEIMGRVNLKSNHPATRLSPLLYFPHPTSFEGNTTLESIEGNFFHPVKITNGTAIKTIDVQVVTKDTNNFSLRASHTPNLESVSGTFEGGLLLHNSGIQTIHNAEVRMHFSQGLHAILTHCPRLKLDKKLYKGPYQTDAPYQKRLKNKIISEKLEKPEITI